jgi:CDP-diacylglycerol pyrophosphatase
MPLSARSAAAGLGCAAVVGALLAAPASCADRDALRKIVEDQCLAHWREQHAAAPCVEVDEDPARPESGYAVLADRKGGAHFLLIPTATITGIESPALLAPGATNYFDAAWRARMRLSQAVGHDVPRQAIGLAVNPLHARSQDQLHIHIECLRPDVYRTLTHESERLTGSWTPIGVGGASYSALRVAGEDLAGRNPFELLASAMPQPGKTMADYTLVVAGAQSSSGPGFIVLASASAAGELLLDPTCSAAQAPSAAQATPTASAPPTASIAPAASAAPAPP